VTGGLARTGRIVSTLAALLAVGFFAFGTSHVSFIQLFGLGTGLAILIDATLVRASSSPPSCGCSASEVGTHQRGCGGSTTASASARTRPTSERWSMSDAQGQLADRRGPANFKFRARIDRPLLAGPPSDKERLP
jgi:hypothetical protein